MGRTGVGGHNTINMTIRELYYTLSRIFSKTGIFRGEFYLSYIYLGYFVCLCVCVCVCVCVSQFVSEVRNALLFF